MPGGYKLRLGDGTVLAVDFGSLATWLVDRKAMVQEEGSSQWYSLHEYLAAQRVAAQRATRKAPSSGPLPLIPPPPKDQPIRKPQSTPAPSGRDALPLIPPPPKDQPIRKPETPVTPAPPAAERVAPPVALTPAPAVPLAPLPVPLQPASEPARGREEPLLPPSDEGVPLLAIAEAASVASPLPEAPPPVVVKVHEVKVLAEELAPRYPMSPDDSAPPIPVSPPDEPAIRSAWEPSSRVGPPVRQPLGVLAEDPWGGRAGAGSTEAPGEEPGEEAPVIRLKPSDSFDRLPAAVESRWPMEDEAGEEHSARAPVSDEEHWRQLELEELLQKPAVAATLRALAVFGGILSQLLDKAARSERERQSRRVPAPAPAGAASGLGLLLGRGRDAVERFRQRLHSPPSDTHASTPVPAPPITTSRPDWLEPPRFSPPRPAQPPPPPLDALPALRLAEVPEPEETEDLYPGGGWGGTLLPAVWLWTKRLVVLAALVVGGTFAALHWERWFPKAGEIGQQALSEIDRRARSAELAKQELQLIEEGAERLPHLAPETIRLLSSHAAGGTATETPALFRIASDAADKGLGALSQAEAEELQALRARLLAALRAEGRERLRAYDRARASGAVFASDDSSALALVAEAVRALPPAETERLQLLLGKAITAGLKTAQSPADGELVR